MLTAIRTTVVDECLKAYPSEQSTAILAYFYQDSDANASSLFCSLLKQTLTAYIRMGKPCPNAMRDEVEAAFGAANRKPEAEELVIQILLPLLEQLQHIILIIDGIDACDQREKAMVCACLRRILRRVDVRMVISSEQETNVPGNLSDFKFETLAIDQGLNSEDINLYIDDQIKSHLGRSDLFENLELQTEIKKTLKTRAGGM